jgi:hypothetical protein
MILFCQVPCVGVNVIQRCLLSSRSSMSYVKTPPLFICKVETGTRVFGLSHI